MKIKNCKITAHDGMEYYKLLEPSVYGKTILLAAGDSTNNWALRGETVIVLADESENGENIAKNKTSLPRKSYNFLRLLRLQVIAFFAVLNLRKHKQLNSKLTQTNIEHSSIKNQK